MTQSPYSTIPTLPRTGDQMDAIELASKIAEISGISRAAAQTISKNLDDLDGASDGLVTADRYSDARAHRIHHGVETGLKAHGIHSTAPFLSASNFANAVMNDPRDDDAFLNMEQLTDAIGINLYNLGLFHNNETTSRVFAEMVAKQEGHPDGFISLRSGKKGYGRNNATITQFQSIIESQYPVLAGSMAELLASSIAFALNPTEEFHPSQYLPPHPGSGLEIKSATVVVAPIEVLNINELLEQMRAMMTSQPELAARISSLQFPLRHGISSRETIAPLALGSAPRWAPGWPSLNLPPDQVEKIRVIVRKLFDLTQANHSKVSVSQLKDVLGELEEIRPQIAQTLERGGLLQIAKVSSSVLSAKGPFIAQAQFIEERASQVSQFSHRFGPYGKQILIGAAALLAAAGVAYGIHYLTSDSPESLEPEK